MKLTTRQQKLLNFLLSKADKRGEVKVSMKDMADYMGVTTGGSWNMITSMIIKGVLAKTLPGAPQEGCVYTILGDYAKKRR